MTRGAHTGVVLASAVVVAWWLTPVAEAPLEPPPEEAPLETPPEKAEWQRIEIERVVNEPPPPPEPEPRPEVVEAASRPEPPRPRPRPRPSGLPAERAALARGEKLLEAGAFPQLRATYQRIGFDVYRDAVLALGGGFFLFDADERRPIAEIDPRTGSIRSREVRAGLSRWPRDVTRHLPSALARGQVRWGERASRVILLPPARLDAALLGALDAHLRAQGESGDRLVGVDLAYEMRDGRLGCEVLALALRDGTRQNVQFHVDLG